MPSASLLLLHCTTMGALVQMPELTGNFTPVSSVSSELFPDERSCPQRAERLPGDNHIPRKEGETNQI